jgi:hypothetical protein
MKYLLLSIFLIGCTPQWKHWENFQEKHHTYKKDIFESKCLEYRHAIELSHNTSKQSLWINSAHAYTDLNTQGYIYQQMINGMADDDNHGGCRCNQRPIVKVCVKFEVIIKDDQSKYKWVQ